MSFLNSLFQCQKKKEFEERISDSLDSPIRFRLYHDSPANEVPLILHQNPSKKDEDILRRLLTPSDIFRYRVGDLANHDQEIFRTTGNLQTACVVIMHTSGELYFGLPSLNKEIQTFVDYISIIRRFDNHGSILIPPHILETVLSGEIYSISAQAAYNMSVDSFFEPKARHGLLEYLLEGNIDLISKNAELLDISPDSSFTKFCPFQFSIPRSYAVNSHETCFRLLSMNTAKSGGFHVEHSLQYRKSYLIGEAVLQ